MKFLKKTLSVGLSLVLCASMTVPAFAASFHDLQTAVDGGNGETLDNGYTGYGKNDQNTEGMGYDIWAKDNGSTLEIELKGNVIYDANPESSQDLTTITISDKNVDLNLNGHTIDGGYRAADEEEGLEGSTGSGKSVITVNNANLTIKDSTTVITTDEEGNKTYQVGKGAITGGNAAGLNSGGGIHVANGNLTLEGGSITGNYAGEYGGGVYLKGNSTVTMKDGAAISNNTTGKTGGGVFVYNYTDKDKAQFVMDGGKITGNVAGVVESNNGGAGGGIGAYGAKDKGPETAVTIRGGEITNNRTGVNGDGGGISMFNLSPDGKTGGLVITGGTISNNVSGNGGGIKVYNTSANISGVTLTGNTAHIKGGGIAIFGAKNGENSTSASISNSTIYGNTGTQSADDLYSAKNSNVTLLGIKLVDSKGNPIKLDGDDKSISGALWDGSPRWGADNEKNTKYSDGRFTNYDGALYLKIAHDKYYDLTFLPGYEDEDAVGVVVSLEKKSDFPGLPTLTREGYTFSGWTDEKGNPIDLEKLPEKVTENMTLIAVWTENPTEPSEPEPTEPSEPEPTEPTDPTDPTDPGIEVEDPDVPLAEEPDDVTDEVEIDDPAVPLASGPVTRAQFVDYLWRHEGEPGPVQDDGLFEDVTDEHEYSTAMAWAKSIGIIEAYEDGTFGPDELVTVSAVRSILTRFAAYADMTMPALTTLTGAEDEAVLNCDEVLAEFFGEE